MADTIKFRCENCGSVLRASIRLEGTSVKCATCGVKIQVRSSTDDVLSTEAYSPAAPPGTRRPKHVSADPSRTPRTRSKAKKSTRHSGGSRIWSVGVFAVVTGAVVVASLIWMFAHLGPRKGALTGTDHAATPSTANSLVPSQANLTASSAQTTPVGAVAKSSPDDIPSTIHFRDGDYVPLTSRAVIAVGIVDYAVLDDLGRVVSILDAKTIAAISRDGRFVAGHVGNTSMQIFDTVTWMPVETATEELAVGPVGNGKQQDSLYDAEFSPDGALLVIASGRFVYQLPPAPDGKADAAAKLDVKQQIQRGRVSIIGTTGKLVGTPLDFDAPVRRVVFSPDGKYLVVAAGEADPFRFPPASVTPRRYRDSPAVHVYDVASWRELYPALPHAGAVTVIAFTADGHTLLTAGPSDPQLKLWQIATGEPLGKPIDNPAGIADAVFMAEDRVAVACFDGSVSLWDITSRELRTPLIRPKDPLRRSASSGHIARLTVNARGDRLATAEFGGSIRLWRIPTGEPIREPIQHGQKATTVEFSPNGQLLLTSGQDGTMQLWTADSGIPVGPPLKHQSACNSACFSNDGSLILSSDNAGLRLWRVPSP